MAGLWIRYGKRSSVTWTGCTATIDWGRGEEEMADTRTGNEAKRAWGAVCCRELLRQLGDSKQVDDGDSDDNGGSWMPLNTDPGEIQLAPCERGVN